MERVEEPNQCGHSQHHQRPKKDGKKTNLFLMRRRFTLLSHAGKLLSGRRIGN
jgi:hypothetical protein